MMTRLFLGIAAFVAIPFGITSCGKKHGGEEARPVDFVADIKPLLQKHCVVCHNTKTLVGKLNLENRALAFGRSERGEFIVPGEPDKSLLYTITLAPHGKRTLPPGVDTPMPDKAPELTDGEKSLLRRWIDEGAKWPDGPEGHVPPLDPKPGRV